MERIRAVILLFIELLFLTGVKVCGLVWVFVLSLISMFTSFDTIFNGQYST